MPVKSAGILMYRRSFGRIQVLLVHPGGPFWAHKDRGAWSLPKGEFTEDEEPLAAAKREFAEETGFRADGDFMPLEPLKQPSGKVVYAWAVEGDLDVGQVKSNTFSLEWPPNSGRKQQYPEVDRAAWFTLEEAEEAILQVQAGFLVQLKELVA